MDDWPQTRAERTSYAETSSYADVISFINGLQAQGAPISLIYMGESTEKRQMPLVIASRPAISTPAEARRSGKPIIYIQANIHAGEVEGKEAAMQLLREWCKEQKGILDKSIVLMTPIYNIDGNEKLGPQERNRPGQDGPAQVGVRANGQNLDLNRDCIKAETPEMRAILEHVYGKWDPDVVVDIHTTNGTRHGYDLTYSPPLNPNTDPDVMKYTRDELLPSVRKELKKKFGSELFDYGNAQNEQWFTFGQEGRYVTNYAGLRNRIAVLSEATVYMSFKDRVVTTERFVQSVMDQLTRNSRKIVDLTRRADLRTISWGQDPSKAPELGVRFDFAQRGTEDVLLEKPPAEGAPRPRGRPKDIVSVKMPINDRFKSVRTAKFPSAYLVPASETAAIELLKRHGVVVEKFLEPWSGQAEEFSISEAAMDAQPFQGHRLVRLEGKFSMANMAAEPGSYLVRTAQPLGVLAFYMLEPEGLDGVMSWGFLSKPPEVNSVFPIRKIFAGPKVATQRL
ncbi:MAG: M14 family metallopeptidase [Fimbriimonadaceae bacterium]